MPSFDVVADTVATAMEGIMLLVIVIGAVEASIDTARQVFKRESVRRGIRETWLRFAAWIVLALEFALAADLIGTIIAPSWDEVGKLAAIATIRTALSLFLSRDLEEFEHKRLESESSKAEAEV